MFLPGDGAGRAALSPQTWGCQQDNSQSSEHWDVSSHSLWSCWQSRIYQQTSLCPGGRALPEQHCLPAASPPLPRPPPFSLPFPLLLPFRVWLTPLPPQVCTTCPMIMSNRCSFSAHQRMHKNRPPHVCPECGGNFLLANFETHLKESCLHFSRRVGYRCGAPGRAGV